MNEYNENKVQQSLIGDALSFAFNGIFNNIPSWAGMWLSMAGLAIVFSALIAVLGIIITQVISAIHPELALVSGVVCIILACLIIKGLYLGCFRIFFSFYNYNTISYYTFASVKQIFSSTAAFFLLVIPIIIGFILFFIPGFILVIRTWFTTYLIVDKNMGPIEAIRASWDMTRDQWGPTLGLIVIGIVMNIVPIIGWLMTSLMTVYVYKELDKSSAHIGN